MLFSIIIPTYNRVEKLKVAVDSVLNQSNIDFELIIVDDGSTDSTKTYVESIQDERVRYIYQDNSGLPSVGRNNGIALAGGEWVCFLDSDDWWERDKLLEVSKYIKKFPNVDVISHNEYLVNQNLEVVQELNHCANSNEDIEKRLLTKGNFLSPSAIVIRTEKLREVGGFNTSQQFWSVEDYELWIRLSKICKFGFIERVLGSYLVDGDGISSRIEKHVECLKNVYRLHCPENTVKGRILDSDVIKARMYMKRKEFLKSIKIALTVLKVEPFRWKAWAIILLSVLRISA